ncbi:MAG: hypothetical protein RML12_11115 [Xanthomonadales bacterium]|nr:hypothetical protein [Xanthomonadales bacterium]
MLALVGELLLLRARPQDLPYSRGLLAALLGASILTQGGMLWSLGAPSALTAAGASAVLVRFGLVRGVLFALGRAPRFVKTMSALLLADLAFRLLASPLPLLAGEADPGSAALPAWAALALGLWLLVVQGHVFAHACEVRLPAGVLIALAIEVSAALLAVVAVVVVMG